MMKFERGFINAMSAVFLFWVLTTIQGQVPAEADSASGALAMAQKIKQDKSIFGLPVEWMTAWSNPPAELRPLQIVHRIPVSDGLEVILQNDPNMILTGEMRNSKAILAGIKKLKQLGLGGIVCNVDFNQYNQYLVSEEHWETLIRGVEACQKTGLIVWIYDEDGYPSGAAGGLVLKDNPEFEALALTYDPSHTEPFVLRPAYEHTHASNNYYAARRYPNLIDDKAVKCFIETTHQAYWQRLKGHFGKTIRAVFTDEPSLMAVNIGPLPEHVRKKVRVVDPLDENTKPLPSVPWASDLPTLYQQQYGENILAVRQSLFQGSSDADKKVRRRFWALISDLIAERYFGQIQNWAKAHHVASSGHTLWEEMPLHHVPLEGNALKVLGRMDIPGMDMLSSNPEGVIYSSWLTASLPASAALFNGGRKVMTEISDFSQKQAGHGPASLAKMQATAAWQAAFGVTEFTLYYNHREREADQYRAYCDFVGRLNALLRKAQPAPQVLLYYPIYDLWAEYVPVAEKLILESQSQRTQKIVKSFRQLGQQMVRKQISFALTDHELLAAAEIRDDTIWIRGHCFDALVLPAGVELPNSIAKKINRFKTSGGKVFDQSASRQKIDFNALADLYDSGMLSVPNDRIVVGRFTRDGRKILLMVNVAADPYLGTVTTKNSAAEWLIADPANGQIKRPETDDAGRIVLSLPPHSAVLLISPLPRR